MGLLRPVGDNVDFACIFWLWRIQAAQIVTYEKRSSGCSTKRLHPPFAGPSLAAVCLKSVGCLGADLYTDMQGSAPGRHLRRVQPSANHQPHHLGRRLGSGGCRRILVRAVLPVDSPRAQSSGCQTALPCLETLPNMLDQNNSLRQKWQKCWMTAAVLGATFCFAIMCPQQLAVQSCGPESSDAAC